MARQQAQAAATLAVTGILLLLIGYSLKRYPTCKAGCQTFANHLIQHGWEDIVSLI